MLQYHTRRTLYHFVRYTLLKSVQIRSFFSSVHSRIRTEYSKIQTRKNSLLGHILRSDISHFSLKLRIQFWYGGCFCENWKPRLLPRFTYNWSTFLRRVKARWWCQWAKMQVPTNQNSRNRWYQIVRGTV